MENSDAEAEEDEVDWKSSFTDASPASVATASGPGLKQKQVAIQPHRVILHFDLDCFYAQVEMIRNPALRLLPLGIQQKYIIVTCNYVAREHGVTKLMSVTEAKEKCPQLVLVKGEDLTHYREMSYKVTELLVSYCPLVETLGFDENFMDVTDMVKRRLTQTAQTDLSLKGHVYHHSSADVQGSDHQHLAVGTHIAAELREAIHSKLGLTGCAGIANNKLLAKLVSGCFKPNQQTTLLPENISDIMGSLSGIRKVPGVGHQTAKRLQTLGVVSVQDLQLLPLADLVPEFGGSVAQRLKNLALGIDESPVTPTGAPQSLSDEDSFKKMSSMKDVQQKIEELLSSLVERMQNDGRLPHTFRLTVRKHSTTNRWFNRESRQCPIPNHIQQKFSSGSTEDSVAHLHSLAMKLFHKMVEKNTTFHLTLINVCFTNLQSRGLVASGKGSITSFFTQSATSPRKAFSASQDQEHCFHSPDIMNTCISSNVIISHHTTLHKSSAEGPSQSIGPSQGTITKQCPSVSAERSLPLEMPPSAVVPGTDHGSCSPKWMAQLPPNIDREVFAGLPEEIQREILSSTFSDTAPSPVPPPYTSPIPVEGVADLSRNPPAVNPSPSVSVFQSTNESQVFEERKVPSDVTVNHCCAPGPSTVLEEQIMEDESPSVSKQLFDCDFPVSVDPKVFSELPPDVQHELMCEWKQQKPALKTPSSKQMGRSVMTKEKKTTGRRSQANNLFKYFKPN